MYKTLQPFQSFSSYYSAVISSNADLVKIVDTLVQQNKILTNKINDLTLQVADISAKIDQHDLEYQKWKRQNQRIHLKNIKSQLKCLSPQNDWMSWIECNFNINEQSVARLFDNINLMDAFELELRFFYKNIILLNTAADCLISYDHDDDVIPIKCFPEKPNDVYIYEEKSWRKMIKQDIQFCIDLYCRLIRTPLLLWKKNRNPNNEIDRIRYEKYCSFKWSVLNNDRWKKQFIRSIYQSCLLSPSSLK